MHAYSYLDPNWLVIKLNNQTVSDHKEMIRGVVYDLGCGVRPYEADIMKHAERYIGVDWSNTLHGLRADIAADLNLPLPIADEVADTVVSFQVLEHLCEPLVMLTEANRILKPNGSILLTVPFQWWLHEAPYDYYRYTRHGLQYLFAKAGFTDIEIREATGFWVMWLLKLNYQTSRLVRGPKLLKWVIRACLVPFWYLTQCIAPMIDKYWPSPQETAGYIVTARKR